MNSPEFVTFHSDRPQQAQALGAHPNANLKASEYARMIDWLFRSTRLFHHDAALTLITDAASRINGVREAYKRVDASIDHSTLMLSRTRAQNAYVQAHDFDRPIALIDSDILVNGDMHEVLEKDFDVALTWRVHESMPINGGFMILNNARPEATKRFFAEMLTIYESRYSGEAAWYGDQLAIADWLGELSSQIGRSDLVERDGCRILFLSCDHYNFSPRNLWRSIVRPLRDRRILHFKGQRKRLMPLYWEAHLQWHESPMFWTMPKAGWIRMKIFYRTLVERLTPLTRRLSSSGDDD